MSSKLFLLGIVIIFFGILAWFFFFREQPNDGPQINSPQVLEPLESPGQKKQSPQEPERVAAQNLKIPWSMDFLPDGSMIFTERPGDVRRIGADGNLKDLSILVINDVHHIGEGGLLGITVHPDFENNKFVYFYYTFSGDDTNTLNRVVRYKLENNQLVDRKIIVDNIPGAVFHNGGRIKFGPDGFLYITTGDAQEPSLSQNKDSLAGKILRVTDDGKPAPGNSFNNLVYSYGHRNPQGLAWDSSGKLWETEHGSSAFDEVNLIESGKNYGWPEIRGDEEKVGMVTPFLNSGEGTWAPSGTLVLNNKLYFVGLRGQTLFELDLESKNLKKIFDGEYGRLRDIVLGPEGNFYIFTNNTDGRGVPRSGDDKLIVVDPNSL